METPFAGECVGVPGGFELEVSGFDLTEPSFFGLRLVASGSFSTLGWVKASSGVAFIMVVSCSDPFFLSTSTYDLSSSSANGMLDFEGVGDVSGFVPDFFVGTKGGSGLSGGVFGGLRTGFKSGFESRLPWLKVRLGGTFGRVDAADEVGDGAFGVSGCSLASLMDSSG